MLRTAAEHTEPPVGLSRHPPASIPGPPAPPKAQLSASPPEHLPEGLGAPGPALDEEQSSASRQLNQSLKRQESRTSHRTWGRAEGGAHRKATPGTGGRANWPSCPLRPGTLVYPGFLLEKHLTGVPPTKVFSSSSACLSVHPTTHPPTHPAPICLPIYLPRHPIHPSVHLFPLTKVH